MRILLHSPGERSIKIRLPTGLMFNFMTATIGARIMRKYLPTDGTISSRDLRRLVRVIKQTKRKYPQMKLVHIESNDGDLVQITL